MRDLDDRSQIADQRKNLGTKERFGTLFALIWSCRVGSFVGHVAVCEWGRLLLLVDFFGVVGVWCWWVWRSVKEAAWISKLDGVNTKRWNDRLLPDTANVKFYYYFRSCVCATLPLVSKKYTIKAWMGGKNAVYRRNQKCVLCVFMT